VVIIEKLNFMITTYSVAMWSGNFANVVFHGNDDINCGLAFFLIIIDNK